MLVTKKISVSRLGVADINPHNLAGMTIVGKNAILTHITLDDVALGNVEVPEKKESATTTVTEIRSLQSGIGNMIISLDGPFKTPVLNAIDVLKSSMQNAGVFSTFLPASTRRNSQGTKYVGPSPSHMRNIDPRVHNVRLLDNSQGMIFSSNNHVRYLPFTQAVGDWIIGSYTIHEASEKIRFLGRVENGRVPVTLDNGVAYFMDIGHAGVELEAPLVGLYTKVFGVNAGKTHIVAMKKNLLLFSRVK